MWLRKTCFSIRIYTHKRTTARDIKVEEWYTYSGLLRSNYLGVASAPGIDISALYNYNYYTRPVKIRDFRKKSGHRDTACISGIIPENPGWLAGIISLVSETSILVTAT